MTPNSPVGDGRFYRAAKIWTIECRRRKETTPRGAGCRFLSLISGSLTAKRPKNPDLVLTSIFASSEEKVMVGLRCHSKATTGLQFEGEMLATLRLAQRRPGKARVKRSIFGTIKLPFQIKLNSILILYFIGGVFFSGLRGALRQGRLQDIEQEKRSPRERGKLGQAPKTRASLDGAGVSVSGAKTGIRGCRVALGQSRHVQAPIPGHPLAFGSTSEKFRLHERRAGLNRPFVRRSLGESVLSGLGPQWERQWQQNLAGRLGRRV